MAEWGLSGLLLWLGGLAALGACTGAHRAAPRATPAGEQLTESTRRSVLDAPPAPGSDQARIEYDCRSPHGQNIEGGGVLRREGLRCEVDPAARTVTLRGERGGRCPAFLLTIRDYHGPGVYNSSSLGDLSLGAVPLRQAACGWHGNLCLDWQAGGVHGDTSCTVEITEDGGVFGGEGSPRRDRGAALSGTVVCSPFGAAWAGCAAQSAGLRYWAQRNPTPSVQ